MMDQSQTIRVEAISAPLLAHIDSREVAVWVLEPFASQVNTALMARTLGLPWRLALVESVDDALFSALNASEAPDDIKVRKRGFPVLIDVNPTDIILPARSLPIYLLNGSPKRPTGGLSGRMQRLNMLEALRQAAPKELLVLAGAGPVIPEELKELWNEGLRPVITVVSDKESAAAEVENWRRVRSAGGSAAVLARAPEDFCNEIINIYERTTAADRIVIRSRNNRGGTRLIDLTSIEDPQTPLLSNYELLSEIDLRPLEPSDLGSTELEHFFNDAASSWRPYAAGLPWQRDPDAWSKVRTALRRLDRDGSEASCVMFIRSEPGAGGTTLSRALAWTAAAEGYPALVARRAPFTPSALSLSAFLRRAIDVERAIPGVDGRLYEVPWVIVFDREHWDGRDTELRQFLKSLRQSGRAVCIVVVTGPSVGLDFLANSQFREITFLSHEVPLSIAEEFGRHLNRYLAPHGPVRSTDEWRAFFEASAVHAAQGISSFWIALSFWVQRQIDMTETVQSWIYRQFQKRVTTIELQRAIVDIAALSTERRPLPDTLLPRTIDWPVTQKLEDLRSDIAAIGLIRISLEGERYWALAHDVLGRFLLNALFYDVRGRRDAGWAHANSPEHLRFLVLRRISANPAMAFAYNRAIAEDFAITIFKIDPDHGHATFVFFWREVLDALDAMPPLLWQTSRAFRHHSAISRRRISKDRNLFQTSAAERKTLLERAIKDISYALENIPRLEDDESDINLLNSLARAYQDLHAEEAETGASQERLTYLHERARDATRRAFRLNPDNPFIIETYAHSLLSEARVDSSIAAQNAVEVLNLVYLEMERDRSEQRRFDLSRLAEQAISILGSADNIGSAEARNPEIDAIVASIKSLTTGIVKLEGLGLADYPLENRLAAAAILADPNLRGNLQVTRMLYSLKCLNNPLHFEEQLGLLESLQGGGYPVSPQQRLELGLLLYQQGRHFEADREFRQLRKLWKTADFSVQVPERLRWLLSPDGTARRQVRAKIMPGGYSRGFAQVHEMLDMQAAFRPEEFGQKEISPGSEIRGYVSFGHNGPFLRPLTAEYR